MHLGASSARDSLLRLKACNETHGFEEIRRLIPPGCNFGYDIVVWIVKGLLLRHRNGQEPVQELVDRHVHISQSEVYAGF